MIIGTAIKIKDLMVTAYEEPHDICIMLARQLCINNIDSHLQMYENYGFYDEEGNFYNRKDAAIHAYECGQIKDKEYELTSVILGW